MQSIFGLLLCLVLETWIWCRELKSTDTQYLSERGFGVLRYDKRGVGANLTILDTNIWGNATVNDLIHDAEKALNILTCSLK